MELKKSNLDEYLTVNIVAEKLHISRGTVYNLMKKGKLKKTDITDDVTRLKASQVQEYMDSRTK